MSNDQLTPRSPGAPGGGPPTPGARRWIALSLVSAAQLMIALDATVTNIALPSAQADLAFTDVQRQWVITAYTVAFGGLLLLGGRLTDQLGRTRAFHLGLLGFAAASALGGSATTLPTLIAARGAQGACAALLAPTVLALIATNFNEPRDRAKAFAVFGAIAASGGATGLVLGGVLAQDFTWRACLYVNVPIALATVLAARYVLERGGRARRSRLDVPGGVLSLSGLASIVAGCADPRIAERMFLLGTGIALLVAFAAWEARVSEPLLPLRLLADRNRIGACLAVATSVAAMLATFLFLTYYLQIVLGYGPVRAGLAFLPLSAAVLASSQLFAARLQAHLPPRVLITSGLLVAAAALALLTDLRVGGGYARDVLPAEILLGLGMGCVFPPAMSAATSGVDPRHAGVTAAVVNTAQQLGGSIGVALLNAVAAGATATAALAGTSHAESLVMGYHAAAFWAAATVAAGGLMSAVLINAATPEHR